MPHILNKLTDVDFNAVKKQLETDPPSHAEQGMYLEHLWRNADEPNEVYFLFRVDDLAHCKQLTEKIYAEARRQNPDIQLPEKIYLE